MWDLTASKSMEVMADPNHHPIQSLSMAANASMVVGATHRGIVYVFKPDTDRKVRPL